jgi:serine phosphatase RsbU (regulator of sigma subunit)/PAS domain-containing protein/anti-sigma regulatory factor (Ser/Thr protein kinase)
MEPLKALIIDDSPDETLLVEKTIRDRYPGARCRQVDGPAALRKALEDEAWDIAIAGSGLPGMDGREVLALVKSFRPDLPCIVFDGAIGEEAEAFKGGARDFLPACALSRLPAAVARELQAAGSRRAQREAAEAIRLSEEKYRNVFDNVEDVLFIFDPAGRVLDANRAAAKWLSSRQGRPTPDPWRALLGGIAERLTHTDTAVVETMIEPAGGAPLRAEMSARKIAYGGGVAILGIVRDLTKRKADEAALRRELAVNSAFAKLCVLLVGSGTGIEAVSAEVLRQARFLTGSEHGLASVIDPGTGENVIFAATEIVPGDSARLAFHRGPDGRYEGLWGHALNTRRGFFTNEPALHPSASGTPAGRVPLVRFLAAPVLLGEELAGLIALANPPRDYAADDLDAVGRLAGFYALAIQKHRTEMIHLNLNADLRRKNEDLMTVQDRLALSTDVLQSNMNQAKEYQIRLVSFPAQESGRIQIGYGYYPSEQVGGDIINAVIIGRRLVFYSADISGHGIPAAILSTYIKAYLDDWILFHHQLSPAKLINRLTRLLRGQRIFLYNLLTLFVGVFDMRNGHLRYANAGHVRPFFFDARNAVLSSIPDFNPAIADLHATSEVNEYLLKLPPQARLLVFSDGLIERSSREGEFVGRSGLRRVLADDFSRAAVEAFIHSMESADQQDDISYLFFDFASSYTRRYHLALEDAGLAERDFEEFVRGRFPEQVEVRAGHCFMECVSNALEHGNRNDPRKAVTVRVRCGNHGIVFGVQDEGEGFSFSDGWRPPASAPDKERGRGLILIKKFANKVKTDRIRKRITCEIRDTSSG